MIRTPSIVYELQDNEPLELEADNSMCNAFSDGLIAGTELLLSSTWCGCRCANATRREALAGVEEFGEFLEGVGLEGLSEYAQPEIAIQNRLSYDPDYSQEERKFHRMESAFAGAVVGGFAGGAGGAVFTLYQNWPQSELFQGQVVTVQRNTATLNDGSILSENEVTITRVKKDENGDTVYLGKTEDARNVTWSDSELSDGKWTVNPAREQMDALQKERVLI